MKSMLVESTGNERHIYESVLLSTKNLKLLGNPTAAKIIMMLAEEELCAIDIARKLKVHEQNIYYHLRNLEKAGVVRVARNEMRYGMTAKMYEPVASVVAAKLFENGHVVEQAKQTNDPSVEAFLRPFIVSGKLNAKIVVGSPYPHGQDEATARNGHEAIDLCLFLGKFISEFNPVFGKIDVELSPDDIKENLIIIGGPKTNVITQRINQELPLYFDKTNSWSIKSKLTERTYNFDYDAAVQRIKNPFNRKKEILLLAGKRTSGNASAVIAFTEYINEVMKGNTKSPEQICRVVTGIDKDGDGIIDSVKFLE